MAHKTPVVRGDTLVCGDGDGCYSIRVGTAEWYAWLGRASTFYFTNHQGSFTARKERFQRGGWYWRGYRTALGKVHRAYLGKAEALDLKRLDGVAAELAVLIASDNSAPDPASFGRSLPSSGSPAGRGTRLDLNLLDSLPGDVIPSLLLTTKLLVPPARADLVARPRLIRRMEGIPRHKLTLISAPAGFGKTTLVSQWTQETSCLAAWVSLDANDNDPVQFWSYVIAALQRHHPGLGQRTLARLHSSRRLQVEAFLISLINDLATLREHLALVLDDYHVIEEPTIHGGLSYLLEHLPPQIHLVIAGRTDPLLPLARLRALGQLSELRASDLSFTSEETADFLNGVMSLNLSNEGLATLEKRIEGWAVGLQLAALSLQGREDTSSFIQAFAGDNRHVVDYLVLEVLRRQPENVQTFLLQTSILGRLSAPLCEAVTGQPEGQAMLEWLEEANLFTLPLDGDRHWYRYHRLFSDFLRARLHRTKPGDVPALHRRACVWLANNGLASEAVDHALAAGEFELAAQLIEGTATPILQRSDVRQTLGWLRALPEDLVRSRPHLCIVHAWALTSTNQLDEAEKRLQDAERFTSHSNGGSKAALHPNIKPADIQRALDEIIAVRTAIAAIRGDSLRAIDLGRQALEHPIGGDAGMRAIIIRNLGAAYLQNGHVKEACQALAEAFVASQASGYPVNAIAALVQLASAQAIQGQLHEAGNSYRKALQLVAEQESKTFSMAGAPYVGMGRLMYEWNDLPAAASYITKGIQLAREAEMPFTILAGYGILARVKHAQGDKDGVSDIFQQAKQFALQTNLPSDTARMDLAPVRLWLSQGNLEALSRWVQNAAQRLGKEPTYQHEAEYMTLAQVQTTLGNSDAALALLEPLLNLAKADGRTGDVIKILAIYALTMQARSDKHEARSALRRALSLAEPEGYVRTFVDLGRPMADLLHLTLKSLEVCCPARTSRVSTDYVKRLLRASGEDATEEDQIVALQPAQLLAEPLNKREREVLRLICEGYSNQEIARDLTVTLNTVKTHISRIFGKLGVTSRTQAAARVRQLGLF